MNLKYKNIKYNVSTSQSYSTLLSTIDNSDEEFQIIKLSDNAYLSLDTEFESEIYAAHDDKHIYVMIEGFQYIFDLLPDEDRFASESDSKDETHENLTAPMPGTIVKVLVEIGDKVEDGTPIIIIEAMKMETKLYSSISGVVNKINCSAGEQVDSDFVLVELAKI